MACSHYYRGTGLMFARERCDRFLLLGVAAAVPHVARRPSPGLCSSGRTGTIVDYVCSYTLLPVALGSSDARGTAETCEILAWSRSTVAPPTFL